MMTTPVGVAACEDDIEPVATSALVHSNADTKTPMWLRVTLGKIAMKSPMV